VDVCDYYGFIVSRFEWFEEFRGRNLDKLSVMRNKRPSKWFGVWYDVEKFEPELNYCGAVDRFTKYVPKRLVNPIFEDWKSDCGVKFKDEYQRTPLNHDALEKNFLKYKRGKFSLRVNEWNLALDWALRWIQPRCMSESADMGEVINQLNRQSSPGWPWNSVWIKKGLMMDYVDLSFIGLKDYESVVGGYLGGDGSVFLKVCNEFWDQLVVGNPVSFWTVALKDEMRHVDKIRENKIRTFTASAVEHTVATNMLCAEFNNRFYDMKEEGPSVVSMSKFRGGWDRLFRRLNKHPNAFEFDESSYDASLREEFLLSCLWLRLNCLKGSEMEKRKLAHLYYMIIHSVCVLDNGQVFQKHGGNPSGSANTIVDNTLVLLVLCLYAWIVLSMSFDLEMCQFHHFVENVELALCGDDNTNTVSDKVVSWYNAENIIAVWDAVGIKTETPSMKARMLKDCWFLSNGFKNYTRRGMWLPIPETSRVLCSLREHADTNDVRWLVLRAYALRIDSWANEECRELLQSLITWVYKQPRLRRQLIGEINGLKWEAIEAVYKTDAELERLYCNSGRYEMDDLIKFLYGLQ